MFAQMMLHTTYISLNQNEYLYQSGEKGSHFYFTLSGKIDLIVKSAKDDQFKLSKQIDES